MSGAAAAGADLAAKSAAATPERASAGAERPKRPPSLVRRLVVLQFVLSAVVLAVGGVALSSLFRQGVTNEFDARLSQDITDLIAGASVDETGQVSAPALTDARTLRAYSGKYWEMVAPSGPTTVKAIDRSRSMWDADNLVLPPSGLAGLLAAPGRTQFYDGVGPAKERLRIAAEAVRLSGVAQPVIFMEAEDRSPIDADIRTFDTTTTFALLVLAGMLVAGVMLQVRIGLQPLFSLRREVAGVRTGRAERVAGDYPAELEPLASELNALVAHNQEVVERQRTHVGNLAHALKTPLSVMAAEAQARPGPLADVVSRQADVMRQQVDHHLRRARAAARPQGGGERTEVAPLLEELALTLERIFRDKGVEIDWRAPDGLFFHGERQDLLELVGNVIENACKWCRARVRVDATPAGAKLRLVIDDDGPGLAAEDRGEVLERGARLDETSPGSGLGLSIVNELARAYGGGLELGNAPLGGLRVILTLPRAEA
ncbi:MAG TPA: ATP-binding protein [Caulobacteraceae bacterium]|nr:ATP-binding protein [Caulobacteraceae bacterium]